MNADWQAFEQDGELHVRAVLEGYLVFLEPAIERSRSKRRGSSPGFTIRFLIPDDERKRAYLAGEGFTTPTSLERAQALALRKAQELRGKLERKRR